VIEQYETLRATALGDRLPLEARSGLALILRRGMWAWARSVAASNATPKLTPPSLARSTATNDEQRAVVRLFAAMAMNSNNTRTHERIAQSPVASPRA
jgi:hypothetical protein